MKTELKPESRRKGSKRLKRMLTWLLTAAMLLQSAPLTVLADEVAAEDAVIEDTVVEKITETEVVAAETNPYTGITWTLYTNGTLELTGKGEVWDYSDGGTSSGVLSEYPSYQAMVTRLIIGEGITYIGAYAFVNCDNLTEIVFPSTLTGIGERAFYKWGESVFTPLTITFKGTTPPTVDSTAFTGLWSEAIGDLEVSYEFKSVYVPEESYDDYVKALTDISSNSFVAMEPEDTEPTIIASGECGENVVWKIDEAGTLTISPVNKGGEMADYEGVASEDIPWSTYTEEIKKLIIEDGVTSIGDHAFSGCGNLVDITIADTVTSIGFETFYGCGFSTFVIPEGVKSIADSAFAYCGKMETITIPGTIESIGAGVFRGCFELCGISVEKADIGLYGSIDGVLFEYEPNNYDSDDYFLLGSSSPIALVAFPAAQTGRYEIPDGVQTIYANAFEFANITEMVIPATVKDIGYCALGDNSITDIYFRGTCPTFGNHAFAYKDTALTIHYPSGDTTWEDFVTENSEIYTLSAYNTSYGLGVEPSGGSFLEGGFNTVITYPPYIDGTEITAKMTDSDGNSYDLSVSSMMVAENGMEYNWTYSEIPTGDYTVTFHYTDTVLPIAAIYKIDNENPIVSLTPESGGFLSAPADFTVTANDDYQLASIEVKYNGETYETWSEDLGKSVEKSFTVDPYAFAEGSLDIEIIVTDASGKMNEKDTRKYSYTITHPPVVLASGQCGDDITYTLYGDGRLELSGTGAMKNYASNSHFLTSEQKAMATSLIIDERITHIGSCAFYNCSNLSGELVIPAGVTSIGSSAFYYCSGFTGELVLPKGLTEIDNSVFMGCSGFTGELVIPKEVTEIGSSSFRYCSGLTGELVFPEGLTNIGSMAFCGCSGFTGELVIPEEMTVIGSCTFSDCTGFTGELVLPGNVIELGEAVFDGCTGFTGELVIPASVTMIDRWAFRDCSGITEVVFEGTTPPTMYNYYGNNAFAGMSSLTAVQVPEESYDAYVSTLADSVTTGLTASQIVAVSVEPEYAKIEGLYVDEFYSGNLLLYWDKTGYENQGVWVSAEMQNSDGTWTSIADEEYTFNYINVDLPSSTYTDLVVRVKIFLADAGTVLAMSEPLTVITDGFTYTVANGNATITGYTGSSSNVVIPETIGGYPVTKVACDFADSPERRVSLTVPSGVLSIQLSNGSHNGYRSFNVAYENPNYSSDSYGVLYNKAKTEILCFPEYACYESEYVIPDTVTAIPADCFNWSSVGSVVVPDSVTSIGANAFQHADQLTKIIVAEENAAYSSDEYGVLFNKDKTELIRCPRNIAVKEYTIPDSVVTIADKAFYYCIYMTAIHLPEGLVTIGNDAFTTCYHVTEIQIPSTVKKIGNSAFHNWDDLVSVVVKSTDVVFGNGVFGNCDNVTIHAPSGSTAEAYAAANNHSVQTFGTVSPAAGTIFGDETAVLTITLPTVNVPETLTVTAASKNSGAITLGAAVETEETNGLSTLTITLNIGDLVCGEYSIDLGLTDVEPVTYLIDREVPAFTAITPADNSRIEEDAAVNLNVEAADTIGVQSIEAKYSTDGEAWESLGVVNDKSAIFTLNTAYINTDSVQVKYAVTDKSGKTTETIYTYCIGCSDDNVAPEIISIWPEASSTIGVNTEIAVQVKDDVEAGTVTIHWNCGDQSGTYTLSVKDSGEETTFVTIPQDEFIIDGADSVTLNITCTDLVGNVSEPLEAEYKVDTVPPEAVSLSVKETFDGITLTWNQVNTDDLAGYRIFRKEGEKIRQIKVFAPASGTSYTYKNTDRSVSYDKTYTYYVVTEDECGNTTSSNEVTVSRSSYEDILQKYDTVNPTAQMMLYRFGYVNESLTFDARSSSDNGKISSYHWKFSDGATDEGVVVQKSFAESGVHKVTLTVTDEAGNSDTITAVITIKPNTTDDGDGGDDGSGEGDGSGDDETGDDSGETEEEYPDTGDLIVKVLDSGGNTVSDAKVCFNLKSDNMQPFYTGSDGTVRIRDVGGAYEIGAFKSGYTPNTAEAEIINGQETTVEIRMGKTEMISGTFEAERMTLAEIEAAGINTSAPANQFVYEFVIELDYSLTPPAESDGAYGEGGIVPDNNGGGGGGIKKKLEFPFPFPVNDSGEPVGDKKLEPIYIDIPEIPDILVVLPPEFTPTEKGEPPVPVVSVIRLPGKATWLKDFFEVSMEIVNLAPANSGIVLENCIAELAVPGGLTLMDTIETSANELYRMDNIEAGTSEKATWILRGDKAGSYHLSAEFSGQLVDFDETIAAKFVTDDPIRVRAGDNLYMDIIVEDTVEVGHDSAIKIGLRNEDEEPYYLPNISLQGAVHEKTYKTSGNKRTTSNLDTLNPGEEIWFEYTIKREDYSAVFEDEESPYYLVKQVAEYVDGVRLHTTFQTVPPNTISGDRVEVYMVDPETGDESSVTYIDLDFDNGFTGRMPDLVIRTYRLNDDDEYEPCAMNFTFNDSLREDEEGKGKGKITGTTNSDGRYTISGYNITQWANEKKYTITVESPRASRIEIPLTVRRSGGTGNLDVTVFEIDENKRLAIPEAVVTVGETTVKTDKNGVAKFENIENGKHTITIKSDDYHPYEGTVTVKDETQITQQLKKKEPGSYVYDIRMSLNPNGSTVVIPYKLASGTITFELQKQIEENEEFIQYVCQIRNGDTVLKTGSFTEDSFTMSIQEMKIGDIIEFAVETNLGIGEYLQADLQVIPSLSLLANINAPNITFLNGSKTNIRVGSKQFESLLDFIDQCSGSLIGNYSGLEDVDKDASKKVNDFTSNVKDTSVKGKPEEFLTGGAEIDYAKGEITISITAKEEDPFDFVIDGEKIKIKREVSKDTEATGSIIFRYNSTEACWKMTLGFSGGRSWTMPLVSPKRLAGSIFALMFSADLEGGVNTEINLPPIQIGNSDTISNVQNGIQTAAGSNEGKFVLGANGGVRIDLYEQLATRGFQSAGVYLKTLIETNYTFPRSMGLGLKFELGWQSQFLFLFSNSGVIAEWEPLTTYATLRRTLNDPSTTYSIVTAPESVQWNNTPVDNVLQSEVFSGAQQQIVTLDNGTKLMVYADTDASFDADNPVKLKYSVNTNGTWSKPKVVCADATVDLEPSLTAVGNKAVLTWTDMGQELSNVSTMTTAEIRELYEAMEIRVSEFEGSSWSIPVIVTKNETAGLVHEPTAASDGNTTMVAWLFNESGTESADAENPDTIRYALIAEDGTMTSGKLAATYSTADNLALTAANGTYMMTCAAKNAAGEYIAYKSIYNAEEGKWNEAEQLSSLKTQNLALTADEDGTIYYIMDGRLYRAGEPNTVLTISDTLDMAQELSVLNHDGKTYFAWVGATDEGIGLYLCYMDESGIVSEPVPIVTGETERYDTPVLAPNVEDSILAVYLTAAEDENCSDDEYVLNYTLNCASIDLAQDISVTDVSHSQPLYAGAEVTTAFTCENLGLLTVSDVTASIYDADENLVETTECSGLADSITWTVPDTYDGEIYTLKVVPASGTDADESNNTVSIDYAFTDLEAVDVNYVGEEVSEEGKTTSLILSLKNNGLVTSHSVTAVVEDRMTDTVLAEIDLGDIVGGAETDHRISVNRGEYADITVTVIPEGFDLASDNNRVYLLIDEEITIEALPEKEKVELNITECSTTLEGEIGVNFYMEIPEKAAEDTNARIQFTQIMEDGRTIVTEIPVADALMEDRTYKFSCEVAAKEMADMITAKFISDSYESGGHLYSVKQYVKTMLEKESSYDKKAVDLAKAMIYYGGYAQSLFGYNTENLAYAEVGLDAAVSGVSGVTAEQLSGFSHDTSKTISGVTYVGSRLVLEAETSFQPYFRISTDVLDSTKFLYKDVELTPVQDGSYYYISIDDIAAKDLDEEHTITVQRGDASVEMTFVPLTYAKDVHAKMSDNTDLVNLVNALYLYNKAADAYFDE